MTASKVYFADMRANTEENIPEKFLRLLEFSGFRKMPWRNSYTAIKIHFGEAGNMAYLRPQYAAALVEKLRALGSKSFLTDCNTLYVGSRKDALEHIETAYRNGYSPFQTGAQVLIGDGLKGTDDIAVPVPNGRIFKTALIGRAIMDADAIISLSHFKSHESTGIGGTLKNLGMGCGSRAGKMAMHNAGKPQVDPESCIACGRCKRECAQSAISFVQARAHIDHDKCVGCGRCIGVCPKDAIAAPGDESNDILNEKIDEYAAAVIAGRPHFHILIATDISPFCDCHSENDTPILPNLGMFCSKDPVALDLACTEMCLKQRPLPGSALDGLAPGEDYFNALHPRTNWRHQIDYAAEIGLGQLEYELITLPNKEEPGYGQ